MIGSLEESIKHRENGDFGSEDKIKGNTFYTGLLKNFNTDLLMIRLQRMVK